MTLRVDRYGLAIASRCSVAYEFGKTGTAFVGSFAKYHPDATFESLKYSAMTKTEQHELLQSAQLRNRSATYGNPIIYEYRIDHNPWCLEPIELMAGCRMLRIIMNPGMSMSYLRDYRYRDWDRKELSQCPFLTLADLQELDDPQKFPNLTGKWVPELLLHNAKITPDNLQKWIDHSKKNSKPPWRSVDAGHHIKFNRHLDWEQLISLESKSVKSFFFPLGSFAIRLSDMKMLLKLGIRHAYQIPWQWSSVLSVNRSIFEGSHRIRSWSHDHRYIWHIGRIWQMQK